ncbi:TPA_asm: hypothetical protein [Metorhabdovirus 1]|nr:TPA_asm: hypothetical protein [Metorhabdovirus 1]
MTDTPAPPQDSKYPCLLFIDIAVTATRVPAASQTTILEPLNSHIKDLGINYSIKPDSFTKWESRPDGVSLLLRGEMRYHVNAHIRCAKYFEARLPFIRNMILLSTPNDGGTISFDGKVIAGPVQELSSFYNI